MPTPPQRRDDGAVVARARGLVVRYDDVIALAGLDFAVAAREIVTLMGRNGAGKSTLLASFVGLLAPAHGEISVEGKEPHRLTSSEIVRLVGLVPQEPSDLFCAETVGGELSADGRGDVARDLLSRLSPGVDLAAHPRDLSEGQRLAVALSLVLAVKPPLLLLDEPTRGLDYPAKARLVDVLSEFADDGVAIVIATHDVELAADVASRTVVLADGEVVADGPTASVVTASPAFAPQVAKILHPLPWMTVAQVRASLEASMS
jgi:energy-coupling factor transport system ATP-binding protein